MLWGKATRSCRTIVGGRRRTGAARTGSRSGARNGPARAGPKGAFAAADMRADSALRRWARRPVLGAAILLVTGVTIGVLYIASHGAREANSAPWYQVAMGESPADQKERSAVDRRVSQMLAGIPQSGDALGQPTAPVTLQVYGDLECLSVRDWFLNYLPRIIDDFVRTNVLRIEYHSLETDTLWPSVFLVQQAAAIAAGRQHKMWNFLATFYAEQGFEYRHYLTNRFLNAIADQVPGLNTEQWATDANSRQRQLVVMADDRFARSVGFHDTPAFRLGRTGEALTDFAGRTVVVYHKPLVTRAANGDRVIVGEKKELGHPLSLVDWYDLKEAIKQLI